MVIKAVIALLLFITFFVSTCSEQGVPVRIGILHSLTGTMATSESPLVDAARLAIEEINLAGGVNGRKIQPIIVDTRSNPQRARKEVERLIKDDKVSVVFGCWTSACRKTVKPIFEREDHLLFYPLQYEGMEQSKNIVYTGATPSQQIIPAIKWSLDHLGKRFYLIGTDYVFPRTANAIIRKQLTILGAETVGEHYVSFGHRKFTAIIREIQSSGATVIINTLNGDSNTDFFDELKKSGLEAKGLPVMSFSVGEQNFSQAMVGHYAAWSYFQSVGTEHNHAFVRRFKERFGRERVLSAPMEAAYFSVHLWALAAEKAASVDPKGVKRTIRTVSYRAPGGIVHVDSETNHTWKIGRIGRIQNDGQFEIIWDSNYLQRPVPFPHFFDKDKWPALLEKLRQGWKGRWYEVNE